MPSVSIKVPGGSRITIPHYPVDMVGAGERASSFTKRSIKKESKLDALYLAITMTDLTTLEGADTPGKVKQLCGKAISPVPAHYLQEIKRLAPDKKIRPIPSVAAICVYPEMVPIARKCLEGSGVELASVATAFPAGQLSLDLKLKDVARAIKFGATEIDMVIDRGAFLRGDYQKVFDEIVAVKDICEDRAHLKVILETGELKTLDNVRFASTMAMEAGADFIKTSTGKVTPAATMPVTLVMLQAIWDYYQQTGKKIGMKPAGGIRTAKQAVHYLVMVNEVLGADWLHPKMFRFGASSLLNDLLRQIFKQYTGQYYYQDIFSLD
ncbi:MAG: deoxyribose-phosphate aldolase [Bacteriovoracaceae bacterium]|jgi:deoxyribose-phosphate aldolase|nr:deoxyribose-phosphate aldolase [Bacteriovoracaceae bacterium]